MIAKLLGAAALLIALPAGLAAQSLHETHEHASTPGKSTVVLRPIAQRTAHPAKCHPDATKAVACEARAQSIRAEALARNDDKAPARLSSR